MLGLVAYSDSEDEGSPPAQEEQQKQQAAPPRQQAGAAAASGARLPSAEALLGGAAPIGLLPPDFGPQAAAGRSHAPPSAQLAAGSKRAHPDARGPVLPNPMADAKLQRRWAPAVHPRPPALWFRCHASRAAACYPLPAAGPPSNLARMLLPLPCSGGALSVGGAKAASQGGMLLPPQLRQGTPCLQRRRARACRGAAQLCPPLRCRPGTLRSRHACCPVALRVCCRGRANVTTEDLSSMFTKKSQQAARQRSSGGGAVGGT